MIAHIPDNCLQYTRHYSVYEPVSRTCLLLLICFTASFFIFCIIFSVFELKHKVALIKSFATSVRPVLGFVFTG